jgi:hypothetical protein
MIIDLQTFQSQTSKLRHCPSCGKLAIPVCYDTPRKLTTTLNDLGLLSLGPCKHCAATNENCREHFHGWECMSCTTRFGKHMTHQQIKDYASKALSATVQMLKRVYYAKYYAKED